MKKLLLSIAGLAIISCAEKPKVDYTLISGKIENKVNDKVFVYNNYDFQKEIKLNEDGTFQDTLRVATGYYKFSHERNNATVFLSPAKDLEIKTDATQFVDSMNYSGIAAPENNFLLDKTRRIKTLNPEEVFSKEEPAFIEVMKGLKDTSAKKLAEATDLDEEFVKIEGKNIDLAFLLNVSKYPYYAKNFYKRTDYEPSADFEAHFKDVDYDNEENYNMYSVYRDLTSSHYAKKMNPDEDLDGALAILKGLKSESIKKTLAENLAYMISPSFKDSEKLYNELTALTSDEEFKKQLTEKFTVAQNLVAGKASPTFDYVNHAGGKTTLADLQGKYVYIDVWATWCGPCLAEIPSLKKVEKDYHDKNIHFVSISIDTENAHKKWKEMVVEKELGGIQLLADNAWESKFVRDYGIEGIPRFILIGPDGKIVNADAPRPSNPKLIELFDELKI